jgi:phage/plasmid-like protein (TIGR03299 family)
MNNVTKRYKIVQPKTIIQWVFRLCKENGYTLETIGVICEGARYFAVCKTENGLVLPGQDKVAEYIFVTTSCDGSTVTTAAQTSIRPVCKNTIDLALGHNVLASKTRHSKEFDPDAVQIELGVGQAWADWAANAKRLAAAKIKNEEVMKLFFNAYFDLATDDEIREKIAKDQEAKSGGKLQAWMQRMLMCLQSSPGADLASARGTLWGALNAVTFDIDHNGIGRTDEARFIASQFGKGAEIKQRMWNAAVAKV